MAITSSAKKAYRASLRKRVFNLARTKKVKDVTKEIRTLVVAKKVKEAEALLAKAYQALDKAAKMHTITKNTASRKKSRLAKLIKKSQTK